MILTLPQIRRLHMECDVIVVGAGGSGLAAAVSAASRGASVIVLEKQPQPGGTTGQAIGSFTAPVSLEDVATMLDDLRKFAPPGNEAKNNHALRELLCRESLKTRDWLAGLGLAFRGPYQEPPHQVKRQQCVTPGAKAFVTALQLALLKRGGRIFCEASVESLLRYDDRVVGVRASIAGKSEEITARRGVILAAGDYSASATILAKHHGDRFAKIPAVNPAATGDGHVMARNAGAKLVNMEVLHGPELRMFAGGDVPPFQQLLPVEGKWSSLKAWSTRLMPRWVTRGLLRRLQSTWLRPADSLYTGGAILVNENGDRYCNELLTPQREIATAAQPNQQAYILFDSRLIMRLEQWPDYVCTAPEIGYAYMPDLTKRWPRLVTTGFSLDDVAARRGLDPQRLKMTVDAFNDEVGESRRDTFGRASAEFRLEKSPWAILGPVKPVMTTTEGGVLVNERMEVIDREGKVIPGLYAVGQNGMGGLILWSHGMHLAWAFTSGRIAGEVAAGSP
jgi:succinate dehydrogenase/fumarate reductase flavoprotein subunit